MKTSYFTFGQSHRHTIDGFVYDKDIVVQITAEIPRLVMFQKFGSKWGFEYQDEPPTNMSLFPRGIKELV
jgi:hypothetical protein